MARCQNRKYPRQISVWALEMGMALYLIIGMSVFFFLLYGVIAFFYPEWVGITGKKAKQIEADHREKDPADLSTK